MQRIPKQLIKGNSGLYDKAYTNINGTNVMVIAHRNGPRILPEQTMAGYRAIVAAGSKAIEQDAYVLLDGTLGVMHDSTLTRTTTSTGNTAEQTAIGWAGLVNDHGAALGGIYSTRTYPVPLLEEVVAEFGGRVLLVIEAKNAGACGPIVELLQKYGVPTDGAIIQSFTLSELAPATAAGYKTMALGDNIDPAAAVAANIDIVCGSSNATSGYIASLIAAGLEVFIYTINRQHQRDAFMALGVTGFFSDDPIYLSGTGYRITSDPFASQTWYHGHLEDSTSGDRGSFVSPDRLQLATGDRNYVLQGWASPIGGDKNNNSYTVQFSLRFSAMTATRWAGVAIFNQDTAWDDGQNPVTGQNGYHFLFRTEGNVQIYKVTDGTATLLADVAGAAAALNTTYNFTLTVTPTGITFGRSGASQASTNDTSYRGGYLYFSQRVNTVQFFDVTITDN